VHSGRVSVLTARGDHMIGREHVLINDWCNQFDVHSVADVGFGPDGALYVSAGDGAGWNFTDYGERGDPPNPCGDPPGGVGARLRPPTAEGGALRAQQLRASGRTALRHPMTLDGTVIRVDPRTGAALPGNPLASDRDPNARKIVAYGLKEPFRFVFRPGTHELWVTDVGAETWEEINRIPSPTERVQNFGWPCYENTEHTGDYYEKLQIATFDLCKSLYAQGPAAVTAPYFAYRHTEPIVKGEPCPRAANFITGIAFATHAPYPKPLDRALYFVDAGRGCAWALPLGRGGLPNAEHPILVATGLGGLITDMQVGPDGRLYVLDLGSGQISRLDAAAR
jgi:glucose/arabinose dehydrogenase